MKSNRKTSDHLSAPQEPFLRRVTSLPEKMDMTRFPFNIRAYSRGIDIRLHSNVTFFVGENGSGKSTLLEAI